MTILAYDPFVGPQTMADCQVQGVGLDELLTRADFVSLHCALNQDTYHLIGERELRLMRKDAILVNVSRGALVDERALYRALREGWIARAALDVTEEEPIAPDNPLLTLDNIVITPHSAAYSNLHPDAFWEATAKAIIALAHGRWPESAVNRKAVVPAWPLS
jgi:phosphoglycerate dehydrogenase-like enzyme